MRSTQSSRWVGLIDPNDFECLRCGGEGAFPSSSSWRQDADSVDRECTRLPRGERMNRWWSAVALRCLITHEPTLP